MRDAIAGPDAAMLPVMPAWYLDLSDKEKDEAMDQVLEFRQPERSAVDPGVIEYCPRCERIVVGLDDAGDLLCSRCRLVL
jgi:hypothetical protein